MDTVVEQDDVASYRATGGRKWAAWQREHDLSNAALLAGLRRHAREAEPESE